MPKKKPAPKPTRGRPPVYGERVNWCVAVPVKLAARVDKRRGKQSRAAVVEEALIAWLADCVPPA
jgi:hypothetical protein